MRAGAGAAVVVVLCGVGGLPPRHNQRCTKARKQCGGVHNCGFCIRAHRRLHSRSQTPPAERPARRTEADRGVARPSGRKEGPSGSVGPWHAPSLQLVRKRMDSRRFLAQHTAGRR